MVSMKNISINALLLWFLHFIEMQIHLYSLFIYCLRQVIIPLSLPIAFIAGVGSSMNCQPFTKCTQSEDAATFIVLLMIFIPIFWVYNLYDAYKTAKRTWE